MKHLLGLRRIFCECRGFFYSSFVLKRVILGHTWLRPQGGGKEKERAKAVWFVRGLMIVLNPSFSAYVSRSFVFPFVSFSFIRAFAAGLLLSTAEVEKGDDAGLDFYLELGKE